MYCPFPLARHERNYPYLRSESSVHVLQQVLYYRVMPGPHGIEFTSTRKITMAVIQARQARDNPAPDDSMHPQVPLSVP